VKILLIEDDLQAAALIERTLEEQGYQVEHAAEGRSGLARALSAEHDLIVADRMLPGVDGLEIVRRVRETSATVPILVLSALGEVDDRVRGLRAGGDDYLTKPFATTELLARIEALLRRGARISETQTRLVVADLELELVSRRVRRGGRHIDLTAREFDLLAYLMRHAGEVVTRRMLLEHVWDLHFDPQTNVIDVHMSRVRQAIERDFDRPLIHTVRGSGYVLEPRP